MTTKALTVVDPLKRAEVNIRRREAKNEADKVQSAAAVELARIVLDNPAVWIVGGFLTMEYAERRKWCGNVAASVAEGGLITAAMFRSLSGLLNTSAAPGLLDILAPLLTKVI